MARGVVNKFNRGEIDTEAMTREDVKRVNNSAQSMVNFIPKRIGSMMYRPGTEYIHTLVGSVTHNLVEFIAAIDDTAIIDFYSSSVSFIVNDVHVAATAVTSTIANGTFTTNITSWTDSSGAGGASAWHDYGTGDGALKLTGDGVDIGGAYQTITDTQAATEHFLRIVVDRAPVVLKLGTSGSGSYNLFNGTLKPGTHVLAFTPASNFTITFENSAKYGALINTISFESAGDIIIGTTLTDALQLSLRSEQSSDIVFCTHAGGAPFQIEHRGDKSWSVVDFRADDGPFEVLNDTEITMAPAALSGDTTLTASADFFSANHVGALFKLASAGQTVTANVSVDTGAGTNSIRVFGTGTGRSFYISAGGMTIGTVTLQRSADEVSWEDIESYTTSTGKAYNDGLDNSILYYRLYVKTGDNPAASTGVHDGADNAAVLTDTTKNWTVNELVGLTLTNTTDGSSTTITANTATTVTGVLAGGTDNDWDIGDAYTVTPAETMVLDLVYAAGSIEGICRVVKYTSTTVVDVQVLEDFGSISATRDWYEGSWSAAKEYPVAVGLSEGRLCFGGNDKTWLSVSDSYYSFDRSIEGDSASIFRTIGFGPADPIKWLKDAGKLILGTTSDELSIRSNSFGDGITPSNAAVKKGSSQGSANVSPVKIDNTIYYVQRSGQRIFSLSSSIDQDAFGLIDTNMLNSEICAAGIVSIAVTRQPETRIYAVLADGNVAVYTVDPAEEVAAWSRLQVDGDVKDVVVLPETGEDRVYFAIERTISSVAYIYLEKMAKFSEALGGTISKTFDSFVSYASPGTTISGLSHLEGETVGVWADGQDRGTYTVASGAITVASSWTDVIVGPPYVADYISSKLSGYQEESVLMEMKRVVDTGVALKHYWPGSLTIGPSVALLKALPGIEDGVAVDATTTMTDYNELPFSYDGKDEVDPRIYMRATGPVTILAYTYGIESQNSAEG